MIRHISISSLWALLQILSIALPCQAQEVWGPENNPYMIYERIHIDSGTRLTILPDVLVKFSSEAGMTVDEGGELIIEGTSSDPVIFDEMVEGQNWQSLEIRSSLPTNRLSMFKLFNATNGIVVVSGHAELENVLVEYCENTGIVYFRSTGNIREIASWDCGRRGAWIINSAPLIENSSFSNNDGGIGLQYWGNSYCELVGSVIWYNGNFPLPDMSYHAGVQVLEGAVGLHCNSIWANGGPGLVALPASFCDLGSSLGHNEIASNMQLHNDEPLDYGQIFLAGGTIDINCGENEISRGGGGLLVTSLFDDLPPTGWHAEGNYWGSTNPQEILPRLCNSPVIEPLLSDFPWPPECQSQTIPFCGESAEEMLFNSGWGQERASQFDPAITTYTQYLSEYPAGKYIAVVLDRLEFCKKAQNYTWSEVRAYFLGLAADSSKIASLVTLCKCNAAWCLAEMGDYTGAYVELDSLLDHAGDDYVALTVALKLFLTQLEEEVNMNFTMSQGGASARISSALERADQRIDSLTRLLASHQQVLPELPTKCTLYQNYPNPFNPTTEISFDLPEGTAIELTVYDILGREVASLANGYFEAGTHHVTWNSQSVGSALASGVYIYRIKSRSFTDAKKMILLK